MTIGSPWCICGSDSNPFRRGKLGRRQTLQATGIGFVATLTSILLGAGRVAQAEPVAGSPPVVDGLSVRILTDNHTDRYRVPVATPGMKVDRTGGTERPGVAPVSTWRAEWGLSMFAESVRADETRRVMIDFGYTSEALLGNMGLIGLDLATIDALVLSHGHVDHFGERAVPQPQAQVLIQHAASGQILRHRAPLVASAEQIHQPVHHLPQIDRPSAPAPLARRDQAFNEAPPRIGQITRMA